MTTEGGDFNHITTEHHMRQTEATADQTAVGKQLLDLLWRGIGGDIEIFRPAAEQQITYPATDQECVITGFIQAIEHLQCVITDLAAGDGMLVTR